MTMLANSRQEKFAQELARGKTADEAYRVAGYRESRPHASRLATNGNIRQRVAELQDKAAANLNITLQWLIEKVEEARVQAMSNGQPSAAVAAIKELGVLSGHRVERRDNTNRNANDLSDDELADIARRGSSYFAPASGGQKKPH